MKEQASEKIVELRQPTQCVLWEHPDRVAGQFAQAFEVVESYEDSINAGSAASFIFTSGTNGWIGSTATTSSIPPSFPFRRQRK